MTKFLRARKAKIDGFTKNSKLRGLGKNSSVKISGARGRRVSIPRRADSFKSKTDNT
jgi:hypothetical protein